MNDDRFAARFRTTVGLAVDGHGLAAIADLNGVSEGTVLRWRRGATMPRRERAWAMIEMFAPRLTDAEIPE
jgi:hypothetical protein